MVALVDQYGRAMQPSRRGLRAVAGRPDYARTFRRHLNAKYDVAQTTDENERHWANADLLSADAAMRPDVRRKVRSRARYEAQENNSYAKGMILTLANDLIGTGPRLNLNTVDKSANRRVELAFAKWCREIRLAEKLRTMRVSKVTDGEAFALVGTNPRLTSDVKLDLKLVEADQFEQPYAGWLQTQDVDAIRRDEWDNPTAYFLLNEHPGALFSNFSFGSEGKWIAAEHVLHIFRCDRPGQIRGLSELVTALPLFAMLRRFTLATLAAAETAADFAAVLYTDSPQDDSANLGEDQWFDAIPIEYRAMLTLPNGWKMGQFKAEHPQTTYQMFKREVINEIARCLNMPFNVAAANSAEYNYASGRMDHQVYFKSIAVERSHWECTLLDRILRLWFDEAVLIPGLLPEQAGPIVNWQWQWFWDEHEHVDPTKMANAVSIRLGAGVTHRAAEYQKAGQDIDTEDARAAESFGVTVAEYRRAVFNRTFSIMAETDSTDGTDDEEEDEQPEARETETAAAAA